MKEHLKVLRQAMTDAAATSKSFYEAIRFRVPEAVADLDRAKDYLFKDSNDGAKIHQIMEALCVKESIIRNRPHDGKQQKPYDVYLLEFPKGKMEEEEFREVFEIVDAVELRPEELGRNNYAAKAVAQWRDSGESYDSILSFLNELVRKSNLVSELYKHSLSIATGRLSIQDFIKTLKVFSKSGPSGPIDALCFLTEGEETDTPLENTAVYHAVTSQLRDDETVLVVEPSVSFIRKWLQDEYLDRCRVTFAVSDEKLRDVISAYYEEQHNDAEFISPNDVRKSIQEVGIPNHVLVFGTRYQKMEDLLSTLLKENANGIHRVSLLAPDNRFKRKGLRRILCDKEISDRTVTTFPDEISRATSPQGKILFQFMLSATEQSQRSQEINIKAYSLLKGNPQKLRKKIVVAKMTLQDFVRDRSIREAFYEKEMQEFRKTERKRKGSFEISFSEEIKINYTLSNCADGRLYASAYVKNPKGYDDIEQGIPNLHTLVKKTTRSLESEKEVLDWVLCDYPYEVIKREKKKEKKEKDKKEEGEKKEVTIRNEIARVYQTAYRGRSITLKTLIYVYPEIEKRLNKSERAQLNKILGSELGDVHLETLSHDYVNAVLTELYEEDVDGLDQYVALKIISLALDAAVRWKHIAKNNLADVVERERKRKKILNAVRGNLVKKFFTKKEMQCIYEFSKKKIKKGFYEYIGVLIRLLTGLENNVVCALKWRDLNQVSDDGCFGRELWQFNICRKLSKNGREFSEYERCSENRKIPCAKELVELLVKERARQLAIAGSEECLLDQQIVQSKKGMQTTEGVAVFPPERLNACGKETIAALGIDEQIIRFPDPNGGIIETDLSSYRGDIFRSNYIHWAKEDKRWREGEIDFVLGNTPGIVFERNYGHFENDMSQLVLLLKQESIATILIDDGPVSTFDEVNWCNAARTSYSMPVSRSKRTQQNIKIVTNPGIEDTHIVLESEYGFEVIVSEVK